MKNRYLKNLTKIEFVVTDACTGRCKHCSEGEHRTCGEAIRADVAADAVRSIASVYEVKTVMAFGGEPLLYPQTVCAIMNAAKESKIPHRQLITNGYFSKDTAVLREAAAALAACGVNDLLLSVDAFHQETIPLARVRAFAEEVKRCGIPMRLQPAWLVHPTANNPYNQKTRELLRCLDDLQIPEGEGNIVFPEGNALQYLAEYFTDDAPKNPYVEDPRNVRCVSFSPNGDVLGDNAYQRNIMEILASYEP